MHELKVALQEAEELIDVRVKQRVAGVEHTWQLKTAGISSRELYNTKDVW